LLRNCHNNNPITFGSMFLGLSNYKGRTIIVNIFLVISNYKFFITAQRDNYGIRDHC